MLISVVTRRFICRNKGGEGSAGRRQTEVEIHTALIVRPRSYAESQ